MKAKTVRRRKGDSTKPAAKHKQAKVESAVDMLLQKNRLPKGMRDQPQPVKPTR